MIPAPRRREPRERDPEYMAWISRLPCVACMVRGQYRLGVHVAHLRAASAAHGKRPTGMAEKPSDRWTLSLCPPHHTGDSRAVRVAQHNANEVEWWASFGIDPFQLCLDLNHAYAHGRPGGPIIAIAAARGRRQQLESPHG